ncbi:hypothetical protein KFU94_25670 [Chloroflexi bacterium TSY]|nr:hypothetical protein [Chloroflexi bacterium TSY]
MTTFAQTAQQTTPGKNRATHGGPRFTLCWILIAGFAVVILSVGAWMLWGMPSITNVPTVSTSADETDSAQSTSIRSTSSDTVDAQNVPSRPLSAQEATESMTERTEETNLTVGDLMNRERNAAAESKTVDEATQSSFHIVVIAGKDGTEVWSSEDGALLQTQPVGTRLTATARSENGLWLYVQTDDGEGWAEATQLYAFGINSLPVLETRPEMRTESEILFEELGLEVETESGTQPSMSIPEDEETVTAVVTLSGSRLNIRNGPSTESTIIGKAYPDEALGWFILAG